MIGNDLIAKLCAVALAAGLLAVAHAGHLKLLMPSISWNAIASVLACPYLMPPDCVDPIPGL